MNSYNQHEQEKMDIPKKVLDEAVAGTTEILEALSSIPMINESTESNKGEKREVNPSEIDDSLSSFIKGNLDID